MLKLFFKCRVANRTLATSQSMFGVGLNFSQESKVGYCLRLQKSVVDLEISAICFNVAFTVTTKIKFVSLEGRFCNISQSFLRLISA